jgi:L-lactate dehydrogenase complex protein LldF
MRPPVAEHLLEGTSLRQRAATAVADEHLGLAIGRATDRMKTQKALGSGTLTNWEELREAGRSIRTESLARLPELLGQLADNVERLGGHVCWAATAEDANRYIVDVAKRRNAKLVAKSKSMACEEIGLNEALEASGVEVIETDLGEWIIQLADEKPSHIIAPAVHKTRGDVAELFSSVAGKPLSDVPAELCAFAREQLRERFFQADIGVSGVNFAIAETGSTVLVTNEGNGRMVTSVPPVHIAVMGMERILARAEQLDVMIALLPRAATGQEISTYTSITTGPRRPGEADGPDEYHLVIVDNGRSDVIGTELAEILHCIRCGACLNACPVYRQIGGHAYGWVYSGPIGAVLTPLLNHSQEAKELSDASSLCSACWEACPVKIPLQDMLLALRRQKAKDASAPQRAMWRAWAATWSRPSLYKASTQTASMASRIVPTAFAPHGWRDGRELPRAPKGGSFRHRFAKGDL